MRDQGGRKGGKSCSNERAKRGTERAREGGERERESSGAWELGRSTGVRNVHKEER